MGYNTTGQSHKNGLEGEKLIEKLFRLMKGRCFGLDELFGEFIEIVSLGGTQNKDDSLAKYVRNNLSISTKRRTTGTFDWANQGLMTSESESFQKLIKLVKKHRNTYKQESNLTDQEKKEIKKEHRGIFDECSGKVLSRLSSGEIKQLLWDTMKGTQQQFVTIIDCLAGPDKVYKAFFGQHDPIYECLGSGDCEFFLKMPRSKTSAQIWTRSSKTKEERNTNLRMRLSLNNGVGAWIGGKNMSSNASSSLCLKIQQDNVDGLFEELAEKGHLLTESETI